MQVRGQGRDGDLQGQKTADWPPTPTSERQTEASLTSGPHLIGKLEGESEILNREQVLQVLSEMARKGSVSAAITSSVPCA